MAALVGVPAATQQEGATTGNGGISERGIATFVGQGCQNGRELLDAMRKLGYVGSYSSLTQFLQPWREEERAARRMAAPEPSQRIQSAVSAVRHISAPEAASALSKPRPMLNQRQRKIVDFLKRTPEFATMRYLVLGFRSILRNNKVSRLARWIREAEATASRPSANLCGN